MQWVHLVWGIFGLVSIFVYSVFQRCPTRDEISFPVGQSNCQKGQNFTKLKKIYSKLSNSNFSKFKISKKIQNFKNFIIFFINFINFKTFKNFIRFQNFNIQIILKNYKTIVAYFVKYTVEKFEKFLIIIPPLPEGGGGYTVLRLSVLPSVRDIFHRIFLSNCWWQKSDIWSQASYKYTILWVAFLDPSDFYFLFADFLYTLNIYAHFSSHFSQQLLMAEIWYLVTSFI